MKVTLNWLKDFVDIKTDVNMLCEKLVGAGFEVEELKYLGDGFSNVVTGKILSVEKHPDADKLSVCQIDVGDELLQIVTGATNVKVGDIVPVAKHNSDLPCGKHITKGKLRGVESRGMLCGGDEMCIDDNIYEGASVDGITILDKEVKIGGNIVTVLGLDDYLLDVKITANRPDCGSVYGLAREIAVILGEKLKNIDLSYKETIDKALSQHLSINVQNAELCPNYSVSVIDNVKIAPSPLWLKRRLALCGMRPINNIVDITNYVLLEMGQPFHAFDFKDLTDKTIIVRNANEGERITLLDGKEYSLNSQNLVIADKKRPVALAGIMGANYSGINAHTKTVAFECAVFKKESVRRTSRELGVNSDSSSRFEKGLDGHTSLLALKRVLHLVGSLNCADIVKGQISLGEFPKEREISFDICRIKNLLGIEIPKKDITRILNSFEIKTTIKGKELTCVIPPYRQDIERDCDIIEELIRLYGYQHISPRFLTETSPTVGGYTQRESLTDKVKNALVGYGYNECVTYSFGGKTLFDKLSPDGKADLKGSIRLKNPLGEELSIMRTTLKAHMLEVISANLARGNSELMLFEVAAAYLPKKLPLTELAQEPLKLCVATTKEDGFYIIKDHILDLLSALNVPVTLERGATEDLHRGVAALLKSGENELGYVGQVHPKTAENFSINKNVYIAELDLDKIISLSGGLTKYRPVPKFPAIMRDFAFIVEDELPAQSLIEEVLKNCRHCENAQVFDVYRGAQIGENKKSVALSLTFRGEQTLQDKDIEGEISKCLKALNSKFGAVLR